MTKRRHINHETKLRVYGCGIEDNLEHLLAVVLVLLVT